MKVGLKDIGDDDGDEEEEEDYDEDNNLISNEAINTCLNFDSTSSNISSSKRYVKVIKYCPKPCGASFRANDPMCIRTCLCPKTHVLKDGSCIPMTEKIRNLITKNAEEVWIGGMENWSPENRSQRGEGRTLQSSDCKFLNILSMIFYL